MGELSGDLLTTSGPGQAPQLPFPAPRSAPSPPRPPPRAGPMGSGGGGATARRQRSLLPAAERAHPRGSGPERRAALSPHSAAASGTARHGPSRAPARRSRARPPTHPRRAQVARSFCLESPHGCGRNAGAAEVLPRALGAAGWPRSSRALSDRPRRRAAPGGGWRIGSRSRGGAGARGGRREMQSPGRSSRRAPRQGPAPRLPRACPPRPRCRPGREPGAARGPCAAPCSLRSATLHTQSCSPEPTASTSTKPYLGLIMTFITKQSFISFSKCCL